METQYSEEETVKEILRFMKNTNIILAKQQIQLDNIQVDIDKLNKKYKNNGNRILVR